MRDLTRIAKDWLREMSITELDMRYKGYDLVVCLMENGTTVITRLDTILAHITDLKDTLKKLDIRDLADFMAYEIVPFYALLKNTKPFEATPSIGLFGQDGKGGYLQ